MTGDSGFIWGAIEKAVEAGDALRLLAILTSPQGEAVRRDWEAPAWIAATRGDRDCLQTLKACGFELVASTWRAAASTGQVHCLAFAITHGYTLDDKVLQDAVMCGNLASVDFLTQHGLPHKPYWHWSRNVSPAQMKCLQLMADRGVHFDPAPLIVAAVHGNVGFVRWLHKHGVPLLLHAEEEASPAGVENLKLQIYDERVFPPQETPGTLVMSSDPPYLVPERKALRYGSLHGAPITSRVQSFLGEMGEGTHAVLRCFKAAAQLSQGPAPLEQRCAWASMAGVPTVVIEEVLILADFDIREALMCRS